MVQNRKKEIKYKLSSVKTTKKYIVAINDEEIFIQIPLYVFKTKHITGPNLSQTIKFELLFHKLQISYKLIFSVENTNIKDDYFRKEFPLNRKMIEEIYTKITSPNFNLSNLKWEKGFDGNLFIYEIKNFNLYDYKSYATCCNDVVEANNYLELNDFIISLIDFKNINNTFSNEIPFICYKNYNGAYAICNFKKLKTNKEIRKYNKSKIHKKINS